MTCLGSCVQKYHHAQQYETHRNSPLARTSEGKGRDSLYSGLSLNYRDHKRAGKLLEKPPGMLDTMREMYKRLAPTSGGNGHIYDAAMYMAPNKGLAGSNRGVFYQ